MFYGCWIFAFVWRNVPIQQQDTLVLVIAPRERTCSFHCLTTHISSAQWSSRLRRHLVGRCKRGGSNLANAKICYLFNDLENFNLWTQKTSAVAYDVHKFKYSCQSFLFPSVLLLFCPTVNPGMLTIFFKPHTVAR